jgi:hypothetical protein
MKRKSLIFPGILEMAWPSEITGQCRGNCAEKPENKKSNGIAGKTGYIRVTGNHSQIIWVKKGKKQDSR